MSDVVIKAEGLGKKYVIGHQAENGSYLALRDVVMHNARGLWQKTRDLALGKPLIQGDTLEEVWALKDVSFEIRRGEAVGIIGRNGAGKSTLLKVLSRITEPSAGRVTIKGRVASLLEVGTGFHPELTGRENIYLNGAILGMTRAEIKHKFDEIVDFAEVERFLDTPVKRYSSGMYVRLAFAVAAHLEPEILVVDEVLAVGDAAFQKKCLGKMGEVAKEGRTVLFVSHNIAAITNLCHKAILLCNGCLEVQGIATDIVQHYIENTFESYKGSHIYRSDQTNLRYVQSIWLSSGENRIQQAFGLGQEICIHLHLTRSWQHRVQRIGLSFENATGQRIFVASTELQAPSLLTNLSENDEIICMIKTLPLLPSTYYLTVIVADNHKDLERLERVLMFSVVDTDWYGSGKIPLVNQHGLVAIDAVWLLQDERIEHDL